jgi:hypothetical protein
MQPHPAPPRRNHNSGLVDAGQPIRQITTGERPSDRGGHHAVDDRAPIGRLGRINRHKVDGSAGPG